MSNCSICALQLPLTTTVTSATMLPLFTSITLVSDLRSFLFQTATLRFFESVSFSQWALLPSLPSLRTWSMTMVLPNSLTSVTTCWSLLGGGWELPQPTRLAATVVAATNVTKLLRMTAPFRVGDG